MGSVPVEMSRCEDNKDTAAAVARYDANILERARSLRSNVVGR
ncbi:hypothetical protein GCM10007856_56140 [Azospirillum oryzae]|nr:hypothetical protein GCM10007856_56140 [Azospirillum oryzae]